VLAAVLYDHVLAVVFAFVGVFEDHVARSDPDIVDYQFVRIIYLQTVQSQRTGYHARRFGSVLESSGGFHLMKAHKLTFNWRRQLANSVIATTDDSQAFSFDRRLTDHRTVLPILHRFAQKTDRLGKPLVKRLKQQILSIGFSFLNWFLNIYKTTLALNLACQHYFVS
jgi:hypothetical protein